MYTDSSNWLLQAAVALLTDSWQAVALAERVLGLPAMSSGRAMVHDMFALGVSLGGVVLVMLLGLRGGGDDGREDARFGAGFARGAMVTAATWSLVVVV